MPHRGTSNEYHNICFHEEIRKILCRNPFLTRAIFSVSLHQVNTTSLMVITIYEWEQVKTIRFSTKLEQPVTDTSWLGFKHKKFKGLARTDISDNLMLSMWSKNFSRQLIFWNIYLIFPENRVWKIMQTALPPQPSPCPNEFSWKVKPYFSGEKVSLICSLQNIPWEGHNKDEPEPCYVKN